MSKVLNIGQQALINHKLTNQDLLNKNSTLRQNTAASKDVSRSLAFLQNKFNDHNVMLSKPCKLAFLGKVEYKAIDPVEQNCIDIFKNVMPSVVRVDSVVRTEEKDLDKGFSSTFEESGQGSGSIIDKGLVITNYHVIRGKKEFSLLLNDKTRVAAQLLGFKPEFDLALLRIVGLSDDKLNKLPVIKKANSDELVPGQRTYALGSPLGHDRTITMGVLSNTDRDVESAVDTMITGVLQTDASINTGSSGGPLVNARGEQIGVLFKSCTTSSNGDIGINYAIPMNKVMEIVDELKANRWDKKPYTGLNDGMPVNKLSPEMKTFLGIKQSNGVIINSIEKDSPVAKAGLTSCEFNNQIITRADLITKINDKPVSSIEEITSIIDKLLPGEKVQVEFVSYSTNKEALKQLQANPDKQPDIPLLSESEAKTATLTLENLPEPVLSEKTKSKDSGGGKKIHIKIG